MNDGARALDVGGRKVPVQVRRSARARRMRIEITTDGAIALVHPQRVPEREALRFLDSQRDWLRERLARLPEPVPFRPGAVVPVQGRPLRLVHDPAAGRPRREPDTLVVGGAAADFADAVAAWLIDLAAETMAPHALDHARAIGKPVRRIFIGNPRSRWGSCSATARLMFSWRLILAPPEVLDYVVAHEVAHLVHRNHSADFWKLVERLEPGFAPARAWLKGDGGRGLHLYG